MKKGQTNVMDLVIAVSISLLIIAAILISWNKIIIRLDQRAEFEDMQIKTYQVAEQLISSTGNPPRWDEDITANKTLGLANDDKQISIAKLENLSKLDYENVKDMLNINQYELNITVKNLDGSIFFTFPESGQTTNEKIIVSFRRFIRVENEIKEARISLGK